MEIAVTLVGLIIVLPFIVLEAMIKVAMCIIYVPMCIILALFYPFVKRHLRWTRKWWEYASTWRHGFYTGKIHKLWRYHTI